MGLPPHPKGFGRVRRLHERIVHRPQKERSLPDPFRAKGRKAARGLSAKGCAEALRLALPNLQNDFGTENLSVPNVV